VRATTMSATHTRMIVLELNELTPSLIQRFMSDGTLPHFSRLYRESQIYTTTASERPPNLDPWIQWVTVHTGLNFSDHGLQRLNEGHTLRTPRVWDLLTASGRRAWICGSMNVGDTPLEGGCVLPDPWTTKVRPQPAVLEPFFAFVQRQVMEHTSGKARPGVSDLLQFARFMATHGLSRHSIVAIARQLAEERSGGARWKRAALLDKLQFDVFAWYYRKLRPEFATFFLNSTAHYQHLYWREMDPGVFTVQPTEAQRRTYRDAIAYGYREMDRLIARVYAMAEPDTTIVMATALSQQPCLMFEEQGGKFFYRPADVGRLTSFAGITDSYTVSPVMAHQFHLYFQTPEAAERAAGRLARVCHRSRQAVSVERNDCGLFVGCRIYERLSSDARLTLDGDGAEVGFFDVFYQVDGVKSGMHHPDGMLWIRAANRAHAVHPTHIPLATVAPTILEHFGVPRPQYMWPSIDEWTAARPAEATA
jgi:hypothetical protein